MMKKTLSIVVLLLAFMACKKRFAEPTYAPNATAVRVWYQPTQFYTPDAEIFLDSSNRWWRVTAFPLVYDNDPNKYGFGNPWTPGRGSNALYMNTIYGRLPGGVTSDSGYYNITIPKAFELIPDNDTAKQGKVNVIPQLVKIFRRDKTSYNIGISGGGTYNEISKLMEVEVIFDETEVGGSKEVKRKYRFRP
ncbi:hypothetical protein [Phnomibacter sp. MR]|uniref:hypothetical protein n=1 Tax=Phnomibacter sp. MR TaxID=3042318 RepID=UPI003A8074A3